ncbi:DUF596 domain-containing protein [Klebsiella michiganensis]|uniref:DUF596 domain-containing protein n=1 Tax=Klebsiella michiganensis TaxID=1134687 RepID=A0A6P1V745_9ENTR|nr:DUF596 domain-containing protein [Klebsiella michiganensis]QHS50265.1 DUF596 domain-containing protein [Klebsiella michiganensis]HDX8940905.1 DUF596 domain-containing protein [Klebsiella michiganensis]
MINYLSDREYHELVDAAEGRILDAILCYSVPENAPADFSFDDRREIFLWVLARLLKEGRIRLAKHGQFLDGTIEEQVELFRKVFPKTEAEVNDGLWFFDEKCPAGAVWVEPDGSLYWT